MLNLKVKITVAGLVSANMITRRLYQLRRKLIHAVSNFIALNLSSVSGVVCKGLYLSSEKEKEN